MNNEGRKAKIEFLKRVTSGEITKRDLMATKNLLTMDFGNRILYRVNGVDVTKEQYDAEIQPREFYNVTLII